MEQHDHVALTGAECQLLVHQIAHGIERADLLGAELLAGEHTQPLKIQNWVRLLRDPELHALDFFA